MRKSSKSRRTMSEYSTNIDLPAEAGLLTKTFLEDWLCEAEGNRMQVTDVNIVLACSPGENFMSSVFRVGVTAKCQNDETSEYKLIVKVQSFNEETIKLHRENGLFFKDIQMYKSIIPEMRRCYGSENGPLNLFPKYFGGLVSDQRAVMILGDLREEGFQMADVTAGMDLDHCRLVMDATAKFHSLGYAVCKRSPEKIKQWNTFLHQESFCSVSFENKYLKLFQNCINSIVEVARETETNEAVLKRFDYLCSSNIFQELRKAYSPNIKYASICHGDLWESNIFFKYDANCKPVDVKFIDFQIIRFALPTTDLSMFFYLATTPWFRRRHLGELLQLYHNSLLAYLRQLDVDLPGYSFTVCEELFYKYNLIGVVMALIFLPMTKAKPEDVIDFQNPGEDGGDIRRAVRNSDHVRWMIETLYEGLEQELF